MAGLVPNSTNIDRVAAGIALNTSIVVHPEYMYWRYEWLKLRDCVAGQRAIKLKAKTYLRGLKKQDAEDYMQYLDRAPFYNMTGQTLNGMLGQAFLRSPVIENIPTKFKDSIRQNFAKDGSGHIQFSKTVLSEVLTTGRFGVLIDIPTTPSLAPQPYGVGYSAENILDWTVQTVNGKFVPTRVLLREFVRESYPGRSSQNPWIGDTPRGTAKPAQVQRTDAQASVHQNSSFVEAYTYYTVYRELLLEKQEDGTYVYKQNVYAQDPNGAPEQSFIPTVRGNPLDFIPFVFFGATSNTADVEKPPLLDIADLNLSHYHTYADLEWGRLFTALPVYYAPGRDDEGAAEYNIGPSVVWEVPEGCEPGIIEYKGEGLKQLESALDTKERQINAIGGRLMPGSSKGSESPEAVASRENSEQALLLNAIQSVESGMTKAVRWWLMWQDTPLSTTEDLAYGLNRNFGNNSTGARELRVIMQMYGEGMIPLEVVYTFCVNGGYVDPDLSLDDFVAMLKDPESFINNPDAQARQRGYASRQQELDQVTIAREEDLQNRELDLEERTVDLEEEVTNAAINAGTLIPPKPMQPPQPSGTPPRRPKGPVTPRAGKGGTKPTAAKKPNSGGSGGGAQ